jgi:hypothetical protein
MATAVAEDRLAALEAKLDAVSHQLDFVAAALREQEVRRGMWDELRHDLAPVTAEAMERVSRELDEVRGFIEPAGLLRLVKRLVRDLPYLESLLDQVESLSALGADLSPLSRDILMAAMARLDDFQRRGYFAFARGLTQVADQVVSSLGEEEWQALAQGAPGAIRAFKEVAPALGRALQEAPGETPGLMRLVWRLRRPGARRGLARALAALEALGGPAVGPAAGIATNSQTNR